MKTWFSPTSPSDSPSDRYLLKSKLTYVFIGLIIFIAIGTSSFLLGRTSVKTAPLSQTPPSFTHKNYPLPTQILSPDITNWKKYTNTKYKFSIKYPEKFEIFEKDQSTVLLGAPQTEASVIIRILENNQGLPITRWWQDNFINIYGIPISDEIKATPKDLFLEETKINNWPVLRVIPNSSASCSLRYAGDHYFYYLDNTIIWLAFTYDDNQACIINGHPQGPHLKDQILSTFKFIFPETK